MSGGWGEALNAGLQIVKMSIEWGRRERQMSLDRQRWIAERTVEALKSQGISLEVIADTVSKSRDQKLQDLEDLDAFEGD